MKHTENIIPHFSSSIVAMGTCLFTKLLLSNGSCILAYLPVIAQQWVYMPHCSLLKAGYSFQLAYRHTTISSFMVAVLVTSVISLTLLPMARFSH
jgi:hypothetical protein